MSRVTWRVIKSACSWNTTSEVEVSHPFQEPTFKHSRRRALCFCRKQIASGLFQPVLTAKEYVGLFCVTEKVANNGPKATRGRAITGCVLYQPLRLQPPKASQFEVILPEGCDPHDPEAQSICTCSAATVACCDVESCFRRHELKPQSLAHCCGVV